VPHKVKEHHLQSGGILLHIGVHKTGTTTIQDAFAQNRSLLPALGVSYPGTGQAHRLIASSAMNRRLGWRPSGSPPPDPKLWQQFVKDAKKFPGITVCSSEFFAESTEQQAQQIIDSIGKDNVHVVITLRNFAKILPSAWQQILKSGYEFGYVHWLNNVFGSDQLEPKSEVFWNRHRHDEVVTRWANIVGKERITVVVVDDNDRESIYRDFELLTGLPSGTLLKNRSASLNRSLTLAEAELLRRLNVAVGGGKGWKPFSDGVHDGLIKGMVEGRIPDATEPKLQTPQWALDRAAECAARYVEAIRTSGVNVMGDLDLLGSHLSGPTELSDEGVSDMPISAALAAILGALGDGSVQPVRQRKAWLPSKVSQRLKRKLS
jgi:hypothetical protein